MIAAAAMVAAAAFGVFVGVAGVAIAIEPGA
jgi:hypothetical protein